MPWARWREPKGLGRATQGRKGLGSALLLADPESGASLCHPSCSPGLPPSLLLHHRRPQRGPGSGKLLRFPGDASEGRPLGLPPGSQWRAVYCGPEARPGAQGGYGEDGMMPRDFWERRACDTLIFGSPWGRRSKWKPKGRVCLPGPLGFSWLQGYPLRGEGVRVGLPLWQLARLPS